MSVDKKVKLKHTTKILGRGEVGEWTFENFPGKFWNISEQNPWTFRKVHHISIEISVKYFTFLESYRKLLQVPFKVQNTKTKFKNSSETSGKFHNISEMFRKIFRNFCRNFQKISGKFLNFPWFSLVSETFGTEFHPELRELFRNGFRTGSERVRNCFRKFLGETYRIFPKFPSSFFKLFMKGYISCCNNIENFALRSASFISDTCFNVLRLRNHTTAHPPALSLLRHEHPI